MGLKDAQSWQNLIVPGAIPLSWLAYAEEKGLPVNKIVQQANVEVEQASSFSAGISILKFLQLMMAVHRTSGEDAIGFEIGWHMPPTTFGSMGYAVLTSATLRDALEVFQRFWHLIGSGINLDIAFHEDQGICSFFLQYPSEGSLRRINLESIIASVYHGVILLVPDAAVNSEVWFDYPEPDYSAKLREKMPNVRFNMPLVQCRFSLEHLDTPLPMASAAGQLAAIRQCELEERVLNLEEKLTMLVNKEIGFRSGGFPTLEQVAKRLNMTARTLRRKLLEEGTSYTALIDAARLRDAIFLLENQKIDIVQVAEYLGYNDAANFTRAFRKWTGVTPSTYRLKAGKNLS